MGVSDNLKRLISAAEPLWAGEAEVVRTYWDSPVRTIETDLLWIARQASKEFNGSGVAEYNNLGCFLGPLTELMEMFPRIDTDISRHEVFERIEMIHEEFSHYMAFADVYDAIRPPETPTLNPHKIEPWPEDQASISCGTTSWRNTAISACAPPNSPRVGIARCSARECGSRVAAAPMT